jgi:hypothetical protein
MGSFHIKYSELLRPKCVSNGCRISEEMQVSGDGALMLLSVLESLAFLHPRILFSDATLLSVGGCSSGYSSDWFSDGRIEFRPVESVETG